MEQVKMVTYRYLTDADFYNMYKPLDSEQDGGGQRYIDFRTAAVSIDDWNDFFDGVEGLAKEENAQGPKWIFNLHSLGHGIQESFDIYQRRQASVCVPRQLIHAKTEQRVIGWRPENGFPEPMDNTNRQQLPKGLAVYFVRTASNKVYAGWFVNTGHNGDLCQDAAAETTLRKMLNSSDPGDTGVIRVAGANLHLDPSETVAPFTSSRVRVVIPAEVEEDDGVLENVLLEEDEYTEAPDREVVVRLKARNKKAVAALKRLYQGKCQVTGEDQTFIKRDGKLYSEAHHLVPLGEGGADNPKNIVVISPLVHRMLHYADVEGLNLDNIQESEEHGTHLEFRINGDPYIIKWHPKHAELVLRSN